MIIFKVGVFVSIIIIQISRHKLGDMEAIIRYDAPGSVLGLDAGSLDYLGVEEEEVAVL